MKIYVNYPFNFFAIAGRCVAEMNGQKLAVEYCDAEKIASKEFKAINMTGKFPLLETPEGRINESIAIAKYLAHGSSTLLGSSPIEAAKVDQWCYWALTSALPDQWHAI